MTSEGWSDDLLTGDAHVDEQHRTLFDMVARLAESLDTSPGEEMVADALFQILVYAEDHFRDEEALMERIEYPGLESQRAMHTAFASDAMKMARAFTQDRAIEGAVLLDYLSDWLDNHVRTQDMALARFLAAEREQPAEG